MSIIKGQMNRDDIIRMAREAGAMFDHMTWVERDLAPVFERFAALVVAAEREECAKVCENIDLEYEGEEVLATWCANAIRTRRVDMNPHSYSQGWAQINRKKEEVEDDGTGFSLVLTIVCGLAIAVLFGTYWWEPEKQAKCHDTANHKLVSEVRKIDGSVECTYNREAARTMKEILK